MNLPCRFRLVVLVAATALTAAAKFEVQPDRESGVYGIGDTVIWTVDWIGENPAPAAARYAFKAGGETTVDVGELSPADLPATLTSTFGSPNAMLLQIKWDAGEEERHSEGGAVAAPDRIRPAEPLPDDFDTFWAEKIALLESVPMAPGLKPKDVGVDGVDYHLVAMDHVFGSQIHGQVARPTEGETFPALLRVQWAGVYGLKPEWVTERAKAGWLALNILPHDLPIDQPEEFYQEQADGPLKHYFTQGNTDRETSYFLRMYLSCYRAVEYLKTRPDWDGRTIVVTGVSQGGQQAFVTAGLHPDVTAAMALVPAGADFNGVDIGRAAGFPYWRGMAESEDQAAVSEAGRYYDIVNFASRITCPILVGNSLKDLTCPPAGIFAAFNQVQGPREMVILPDAGHQAEGDNQQAYWDRVEQTWLPALLAGGRPPVAGW